MTKLFDSLPRIFSLDSRLRGNDGEPEISFQYADIFLLFLEHSGLKSRAVLYCNIT